MRKLFLFGSFLVTAAILLVVTAQPANAGATNRTWTGAVSNDWFNAANWDTGVPTIAENAVINAVANLPLISSGTATARDFSGAGTTTMSGGVLQISHDFKPAAPSNFIANGGTVEFVAAGAGGGSFKPAGTYNFYNVTIDGGIPGFKNAANTIVISHDLRILNGGHADFIGTANTANRLYLSGNATSSGTWGSASSSATNKTNTYFNPTSTGLVTVAVGNTATLTYSAGSNGSLTGSTTQVVTISSDGTAVTAVADVGYHFVDWSDASTANPRTDTNVSGNVTVTANFGRTYSGGRSTQEKLPPLNTSILVNNDAATTASTAVTLNLAATGATEMILSNLSTFEGAEWQTFTTIKSWTLTGGVGVKEVWARFRDAAKDTSAPISDSITLVAAPAETPATTTPPAEQPAGTVGGCPTLVAGDMVKVTGKPAIYSLNDKLEVLYFPNGDVFKSWHETYGGYLSITQECFDNLKVPAAYPGAINFRPGTYVVKRASSDQLYVVEPHNTLAKISSTDAASLYGAAYKAMTVDDPFWPHYINRGADVSTAMPHEGMLVKVNDVTYYVDAGKVLREVTAEGMTANTFQAKFVRALSSASISGFSIGEKITAEVPALTNKAQP
jgi:hypothetical protein